VKRVVADRRDDAADPTVVEPHGLADAHHVDQLRRLARDVRGDPRAPWRGGPRQRERVAEVQDERALERRQRVDGGLAVGPVHDGPGLHIGCPFGQDLRGSVGHRGHAPATDTAASVAQLQLVAGFQCRHERGRHRHRWRASVGRGGRQPRPCGGEHLSQRVPLRAQLEHLGARRERAGAALGTGQIDGDLARPSERAGGLSHVVGHRSPRRQVVVRGVDAGAVHAVTDERVDPCGVVGVLAREGHHDPDPAGRRGRSEQPVAVLLKERPTALAGHGARVGPRARVAADDPVEHREHGLQRGQHVWFTSPERREAALGELPLELPIVAPTQRQVVQQVHGARPLRVVNRGEQMGGLSLAPTHLREQSVQCVAQGGPRCSRIDRHDAAAYHSAASRCQPDHRSEKFSRRCEGR
jgi:hypothetical protein